MTEGGGSLTTSTCRQLILREHRSLARGALSAEDRALRGYITGLKPSAQGPSSPPQIRTSQKHTLPHLYPGSQPSPRRKPGATEKTQRRGWDPGLLSQKIRILTLEMSFSALIAQLLAHCQHLDLDLFTWIIYSSLVWRSSICLQGACCSAAVSTRPGGPTPFVCPAQFPDPLFESLFPVPCSPQGAKRPNHPGCSDCSGTTGELGVNQMLAWCFCYLLLKATLPGSCNG